MDSKSDVIGTMKSARQVSVGLPSKRVTRLEWILGLNKCYVLKQTDINANTFTRRASDTQTH